MKKYHLSAILIFTIAACLDKFSIGVNPANRIMVVDGMITDEAGPYTVKLSWASNVDHWLEIANPVEGATISISDDEGLSEVLIDSGNGIYQTKENGIQGEVGRTYQVNILTPDGQTYASVPERLNAAGEIDSLYFKFTRGTSIPDGIPLPKDGFDIFVNTKVTNSETALRWKWTGTFQVYTHPELALIKNAGGGPAFLKAPLPCSGYITPDDGLTIEYLKPCKCCTCWITQTSDYVTLSDDQFGAANQNVNVAYLPVDSGYFDIKYFLEIQQLSVSQNTYQFWKLVNLQKSGSSNLFQPPIGKVIGNIIASSANTSALGIFSASGIARKSIWIYRSDIPYSFRNALLIDDCTTLDKTSTLEPPSFWQ